MNRKLLGVLIIAVLANTVIVVRNNRQNDSWWSIPPDGFWGDAIDRNAQERDVPFTMVTNNRDKAIALLEQVPMVKLGDDDVNNYISSDKAQAFRATPYLIRCLIEEEVETGGIYIKEIEGNIIVQFSSLGSFVGKTTRMPLIIFTGVEIKNVYVFVTAAK